MQFSDSRWWVNARNWEHDVRDFVKKTTGFVSHSFALDDEDERIEGFYRAFAAVVTSEIIQGINVYDYNGSKRYDVYGFGPSGVEEESSFSATNNLSVALIDSNLDANGVPVRNSGFRTFAEINERTIAQAHTMRKVLDLPEIKVAPEETRASVYRK